MQRFDTSNTAGLTIAVEQFLKSFPDDLTCPVQVWYEALGGYGTPSKDDEAAIAAVLDKQCGWESIGAMRYEKYGSQPTWKNTAGMTQPNTATDNKYAVQHLFKVNGVYATPEGKKYKIVLSEVYNLRCFELDDKGNMIGPMVKIHPTSDLAKSMKAA